MALRMQDLKLPGADTRLVLFRSTVFKLKYKMSHEGGSEKSDLKSEIFQEDVKRATAAILSQTLEYGTPPHVKTDNITVHTATQPWTICHKLHFSHHHLTLTPHPHTILMLVALIPSDHAPRNLRPHPHLGKHTRDECPSDEGRSLLSTTHSDASWKRVCVSPENCVHVPVPTNAALPVSWKELQKGAPSREVVLRAAEERRRRLQLLSKPCCEGEEEEEGKEEEEEQSGRESIFSYFKRLLGWM